MNRHEADKLAYRRMKPEIDRQYPKGHFVAIENGEVIADAGTYEEIDAKLNEIRPHRCAMFVARVGDDMPEYVDFLGSMMFAPLGNKEESRPPMSKRRTENQAAFRRLKPEIDARFPKGRYVAIDGGKVVADAATFEEIDARLCEIGLDSPDVLVAVAQDELPHSFAIL